MPVESQAALQFAETSIFRKQRVLCIRPQGGFPWLRIVRIVQSALAVSLGDDFHATWVSWMIIQCVRMAAASSVKCCCANKIHHEFFAIEVQSDDLGTQRRRAGRPSRVTRVVHFLKATKSRQSFVNCPSKSLGSGMRNRDGLPRPTRILLQLGDIMVALLCLHFKRVDLRACYRSCHSHPNM
jgi:hypothetical protein